MAKSKSNGKKNKTLIILGIVILVLAVAAIVLILTIKPSTAPEDDFNKDLGIEADDPGWHGNSKVEISPEETDEEGNVVTPAVYDITCKFEGKIDENSFEVTEINVNTQTGEEVEGTTMQMRCGNESVKSDVNVAEIGEKLTISYSYNEYDQAVADRVMFLQVHE